MHAKVRDVCILATTSAVISTLILCFGKPTWFEETYLNYAAHMTQGRFEPSLYWRTAGYPIFLILTGVIATGSIWGALIAQGIAGASLPVLIYLILVPINRATALIAAAVSAGSLISYQYILTVFPDELYIVGLVALVYFVSRWLMEEDAVGYLYGVAATCFVLSSLRPVGAVFAVGCLAIALWRRRALRHVALCTAIFIGAPIALHAWQQQFGEVRSFTGRQVFMNMYLESGGMDTTRPRATELRRLLVEFFRTEAHKHDLRGWAGTDEEHQRRIVQYIGKPEEQVAAMFREPTTQYYWTMYLAADVMDPKHGDDLFLKVAIEYARANPLSVAHYVLDHYRTLVFGQTWWFTGSIKAAQGILFEPLSPRSTRQNIFRDHMVVPISKEPFLRQPASATADLIQTSFVVCYRVIFRAAYVLMLIGALGFAFTPGPARTTAFTVLALHSVNVVALAALVDPQFRYQIQSVPLAIIGGAIGAYRIAEWSRLAFVRWAPTDERSMLAVPNRNDGSTVAVRRPAERRGADAADQHGDDPRRRSG